MADDIRATLANHQVEIESLAAETLALQTILAHVLDQVAKVDVRIAAAIRKGFDDAADDTEDIAIKLGKSASPDHTVKALGVIEYMRTATFGYQDKPKHGV
jgi:hypothetical protein